MILQDTRKVTADHGPRPAGKPDECFYCHEKVGGDHKDDCVLFQKLVVVEVKFTYIRTAPAGFTDQDIEFGMNESSSCADNMLAELNRLYPKDDEFAVHCLCGHAEGRVLRDATVEDTKLMPVPWDRS